MSAPSVCASGSWAACVSAFLARYGMQTDPGVCLVMASGLWFAREPVEDLRGCARSLRVRFLNPTATEYLAAALQVPLVSLRRADPGQWYWLARRARGGKLTLIKLAGVPATGVTPVAADPVFALVRAVEPAEDDGARPGDPPPAELRVRLDFGGGVCPWVTLDALLPLWLDAGDRELTAESYALLPPRLRARHAGPDWRGALARQLFLMSEGEASGVGALRAWRAELRAAGGDGEGALAWSAALRTALGPDGTGCGRALFADGLEALRPWAAAATEAAHGFRAADAAWRRAALRLALDPPLERQELDELLGALEAVETSAFEGLRSALREAV